MRFLLFITVLAAVVLYLPYYTLKVSCQALGSCEVVDGYHPHTGPLDFT